MIPPKSLAFEWMRGFSSGASHGAIPQNEPNPELREAWQNGYDIGRQNRELAREFCERKYGIQFSEIKQPTSPP